MVTIALPAEKANDIICRLMNIFPLLLFVTVLRILIGESRGLGDDEAYYGKYYRRLEGYIFSSTGLNGVYVCDSRYFVDPKKRYRF